MTQEGRGQYSRFGSHEGFIKEKTIIHLNQLYPLQISDQQRHLQGFNQCVFSQI